MNTRHLLPLSALAGAVAWAGLPAAQAQTVQEPSVVITSVGGTYQITVTPFVTSPTVAGSDYKYAYQAKLTKTGPSVNVNTFLFNFSSNTVSFDNTTPPTPFTLFGSDTASGVFAFDTPGNTPGLVSQNQQATFSFLSPLAPKGGVLAIGTTSNSGNDAGALGGILGPGAMPSPEPGSLTSLAVLGGCLALGIAARRRISQN